MDEAMAPPHKRRKLSSHAAQHFSNLDNSTVALDAITSFTHSVEHLRTHSSLAAAATHSHRDDEDRLQVQHAPVGGIEDFKVLLPRQGTGSSSSSPAATAPVDSTAMNNLPSLSLPSVSASRPSNPTDTTTAGASTGSIISGPSSVSVSLTNNATLSRTIASSGSSTASLNLTTSAIIIIGEGSTTTSKTTITLGGTTTSVTTTTDTDASLLYLATLSNGDVSTLTRSSSAYTTAFGTESFTIPSRTSARPTNPRTSTDLEATSADSSRGDQSTVTSIATVGVAGGGQGQGSPTNASPTTSSTSNGSNNDDHNDNTPPAGTIAGGVVGGCAGLAVVLLIAMLFVRWYRRKARMQHQALPPGSISGPGDDQAVDRSAPGMAERAGLMPLVAAIPGLMRHRNRSREVSEPSERGFTRVSGRKLPSAFSEGMTSEGPAREQPPPAMPLSSSPPDAERSLSGNSFYRDSTGFYGDDGENGLTRSSNSPTSPGSNAPIRGTAPEPELMMGPQRQPQVHAGGPYNMTPTSTDFPSSPAAATATFGRSETPASLRNSRFTEDM